MKLGPRGKRRTTERQYAKLLRSLIRAKPRTLRFVSVKGAMANKFSSCQGEQVKSKGASFQESAGSLLADAGYNPASRGASIRPSSKLKGISVGK